MGPCMSHMWTFTPRRFPAQCVYLPRGRPIWAPVDPVVGSCARCPWPQTPCFSVSILLPAGRVPVAEASSNEGRHGCIQTGGSRSGADVLGARGPSARSSSLGRDASRSRDPPRAATCYDPPVLFPGDDGGFSPSGPSVRSLCIEAPGFLTALTRCRLPSMICRLP